MYPLSRQLVLIDYVPKGATKEIRIVFSFTVFSIHYFCDLSVVRLRMRSYESDEGRVSN